MITVLEGDNFCVLPCNILITSPQSILCGFNSLKDAEKATEFMKTMKIFARHGWGGLSRESTNAALGDSTESFVRQGFIVLSDDGFYKTTHRFVELFHHCTYPPDTTP